MNTYLGTVLFQHYAVSGGRPFVERRAYLVKASSLEDAESSIVRTSQLDNSEYCRFIPNCVEVKLIDLADEVPTEIDFYVLVTDHEAVPDGSHFWPKYAPRLCADVGRECVWYRKRGNIFRCYNCNWGIRED